MMMYLAISVTDMLLLVLVEKDKALSCEAKSSDIQRPEEKS
jgi:hypothetical protein